MASHLLVCHHSLTMFLLAYISLLVTFSNGSVLAFEQSAPQNHISQQLPESLARDASMRFRDQFFQPYVMRRLRAQLPPLELSDTRTRDSIRAPVKRSSIMLNRLKAAIERALDSREVVSAMENVVTTTTEAPQRSAPRAMALTNEPVGARQTYQNVPRRRLIGGDEESLMKCYFNAVACF